MQVKASVTFTTYFEIPDGITLQEVRNEALGEINEAITSDEVGESVENQMSSLLGNSIKLGIAERDSVEISIQKAE